MQVSILKATILLMRKPFAYWMHMDGMQEDDRKGSSLDRKRPLVVRALRRSNVRRKIADYLFDISPSSSYTSEIAHNVKTTPTNVIGAIRGMQSRYREDESLLALDIVEMKKAGNDIKLYGMTPFGKEILQSIKDRE
ncbi:MAG: archaellum operon transcriptional activator EarA family protein [Candidatus Thermoplasmatota archaeon]|nr:archaellum operon transcriptional activator EarA family protein [Candidatus Thermoplasmatota archaeon]